MISAGWLAEIFTIKKIGYRMMRLTTARYRYKGRGCSSFLGMGFPVPFHDGQIGNYKDENNACEYRPASCRKGVVLPGILAARKGRNQRCVRGASQDTAQVEDTQGLQGPADDSQGDT